VVGDRDLRRVAVGCARHRAKGHAVRIAVALARKLGRKAWEKRERNAEIYRRYVAGEDSVRLARAFGLPGRRVWSIIRAGEGLGLSHWTYCSWG
jgi:hypothetical protein